MLVQRIASLFTNAETHAHERRKVILNDVIGREDPSDPTRRDDKLNIGIGRHGAGPFDIQVRLSRFIV